MAPPPRRRRARAPHARGARRAAARAGIQLAATLRWPQTGAYAIAVTDVRTGAVALAPRRSRRDRRRAARAGPDPLHHARSPPPAPTGGVSAPFAQLSAAPEALRQARVAALCARAGLGPVAAYDELGSWALIASLWDGAGRPAPPATIVALAAAPPRRAAARGARRPARARRRRGRGGASALSMHRATLYRRLERIEEITGLDLRRGDDRLLAHLGLRLHRLRRAEARQLSRAARESRDAHPSGGADRPTDEHSCHGRHDPGTHRDLDDPIMRIGTDLAARMPRPRAVSTARVERRMQELLIERSRAARGALPLRRRPPGVRDARRRHPPPARAARRRARVLARPPRHRRSPRSKLATRPVAAIAATGVKQMAQRFIVGEDAKPTRCRRSPRLWKRGVDATVDLLGEATVTEAEADRYMQRCEDALRTLAGAARKYPARDVNLSVKVSALTPLLRPEAPERGIEGARPRLRHLLRVARDVQAHLHVDMESFDTREAITRLTLDLLAEPEFAERPERRHRPAGLPRRVPAAPRRAAGLGRRAPRASTRSRSAWSRAPTGTTRSSRPRSTAGPRRSSPTAASATATSSCSPSA